MLDYLNTLLQARRRRATYRSLTELDDRLLADLGIDRNDLNRLRRGHVTR